jgi:hypothetical protein
MADHQCKVCQDLVPTFYMQQCALCGELVCGDCVEPFKGDTVCTDCVNERLPLQKGPQDVVGYDVIAVDATGEPYGKHSYPDFPDGLDTD